MSDPYEKAKGGRLTFKGGSLATRKSIDKKKKKKKQHHKHDNKDDESQPSTVVSDPDNDAGKVYTIDAAKNMKYDELFPVEAKRFGYDPKTTFKNVEEALDDRVKKKADRYCK